MHKICYQLVRWLFLCLRTVFMLQYKANNLRRLAFNNHNYIFTIYGRLEHSKCIRRYLIGWTMLLLTFQFSVWRQAINIQNYTMYLLNVLQNCLCKDISFGTVDEVLFCKCNFDGCTSATSNKGFSTESLKLVIHFIQLVF